MEIEQYICPNCQVRLKKCIWELSYSSLIDDVKVDLYEGICKNCKSRFSFFFDPSYDKAIFWRKEHESIFKNAIDKKTFFGSVKLLYLTEEKNVKDVLKKFDSLPLMSMNIIVSPYCYSDLINKQNLRKNNKIIFIEQDILDTKFEKNYPCILAEKNIIEAVKDWNSFRIYSNQKTYYKIFEYLGE